MKWMGWGYSELGEAPPDYVERILELMAEAAERRE